MFSTWHPEISCGGTAQIIQLMLQDDKTVSSSWPMKPHTMPKGYAMYKITFDFQFMNNEDKIDDSKGYRNHVFQLVQTPQQEYFLMQSSIEDIKIRELKGKIQELHDLQHKKDLTPDRLEN